MTSLPEIIEDIREIFVTKEVFELRFSPMEKIVYGLSGMALISIFGAIFTLVIRK